jgi:hypothetical protein
VAKKHLSIVPPEEVWEEVKEDTLQTKLIERVRMLEQKLNDTYLENDFLRLNNQRLEQLVEGYKKLSETLRRKNE